MALLCTRLHTRNIGDPGSFQCRGSYSCAPRYSILGRPQVQWDKLIIYARPPSIDKPHPNS